MIVLLSRDIYSLKNVWNINILCIVAVLHNFLAHTPSTIFEFSNTLVLYSCNVSLQQALIKNIKAIVKLNYNSSFAKKKKRRATIPVHQQFTAAFASYVALKQDENGSGLPYQENLSGLSTVNLVGGARHLCRRQTSLQADSLSRHLGDTSVVLN